MTDKDSSKVQPLVLYPCKKLKLYFLRYNQDFPSHCTVVCWCNDNIHEPRLLFPYCQLATLHSFVKGCRTMFSVSEEEVIKDFLLSCWNKKLRVPQVLFLDALKKHIDRFPRKTKAKNNRPSHFWRQVFIERHPSLLEAYETYKAAYKDYDVVSDHMLNKFISDLACVDKPPPLIEQPSRDSSSSVPKKTLIGKKELPTTRRTSLPAGMLSKSSNISTSITSGKFADKSRQPIKHQRAKTFNVSTGSIRNVSLPGSSSKRNIDLPFKKRGYKQPPGLKLSPALFTSNKTEIGKKEVQKNEVTKPIPTPTAAPAKVSSSPVLKKRIKEVPKKKIADTFNIRSKVAVAAEAIPLQPVKYEIGANIEAMDGAKWYKAKIIQIYHDRKEILVHYNGWRKRFDTVFPMGSGLIRGPTQVEKKTQLLKFNVGDDVLSQWTDGSFYPGTVMSIKESGSYVVMFYDGLKKLVRPNLLKPMSEKEKEAAMKVAQATYLLSSDVTLSSSLQQDIAAGGGQNYRRYRTSAHDREQRVAARHAEDSPKPTASRRGRKRKLEQTSSSINAHSPPEGGNFHAKQARLDKITGTLLDKAVTTAAISATASDTIASSSPARLSTATTVVESDFASGPPISSTGDTHDAYTTGDDIYFSDDSDSRLVIDEDGDIKSESKGYKASSKIESPSATSTADSSNESKSDGKSVTPSRPPVAGISPSSRCESEHENLHQLADLALSRSSSIPPEQQATFSGTGNKRQEASEALLQLAHSATGSHSDVGTAKKPEEPTTEAATEKVMPLDKRVEMAVEKIIKEKIAVAQAASIFNTESQDLSDALYRYPGVVNASSDPLFLDTYEEDMIVNWIHDITDLGWGISNVHIAYKIKLFLTEEARTVIFDEASATNLPSESWLNDFLERHPEIFPGRVKPLTRFRFDREGFEDWLDRWLAVLRSSPIPPNAVYYCDETVWDANPKLMHGVQFVHQSIALSNLPPTGNKITTLSCVGADGAAFSPFHIFPDNEGNSKIPGGKLVENIVFSHHGVLSSRYFLQWMKKNFLRGIPARKRAKPIALLVDTHLEMLDFEVLKFAQRNKIHIYRFLPPGAHFIQHPDQKLFGRLRLQWKKAVFGEFMTMNAGKEVSTQSLATYFKHEFFKAATPSTIKMCFELTKLYTPVPEPIREETRPGEKRNKRKSTKPIPYMVSSDASDDSLNISGAESPIRINLKPITSEAVKSPGGSVPSSNANIQRIPVVTKKSPAQNPLPPLKTIQKKSEVPLRRRGRPKGVKTTRRKSVEVDSKPSEKVDVKEAAVSTLSDQSASQDDQPNSGPVLKSNYKKGELVLAKWADCRLYSATVLKKIDDSNYKIRYFDGFIKVVNTDFLRAWSGLEALNTPTKKAPVVPHSPVEEPQVSHTDKQTSAITSRRKSLALETKKKPVQRSTGVQRRHSLNLNSKVRTRRGSGTAVSGGNRNRRSAGNISEVSLDQPDPKARSRYKPGDSVLCRWTDLKMYPATILKHTTAGQYLVKYFDDRKRVVPYSWLSQWKPPSSVDKSSKVPATKKEPSLPAQKTLQKEPSPQHISQDEATESLSPPDAQQTKQAPSPPRSEAKVAELPVVELLQKDKVPLATHLSPKSPQPDTPTLRSSVPAESRHPAPEQPSEQEAKIPVLRSSVSIKTPPSLSDPTLPVPTVQLVKPEPPLPSSEEETLTPKLRPRKDAAAKSVKDGSPLTKNVSEKRDTPRRISTDSHKSTQSAKSNEAEHEFKKGDCVLARWADCKRYPATILKVSEEDMYIVQYYDGMTRTLKKEMLQKWDPNVAPKPRRAVYRRKDKTTSKGAAVTKSDDVQDVQSKTKEVKQSERSATTSQVKGDKPAVPARKPSKVVYTYEAYYAKLTQESELHKFKCRVPGCNKVFRRESVLKQHHKHYHLQRYKLRDQESAPAQKRKASRDDPVPAKRRVSADYHLHVNQQTKPAAPSTAPLHGKPTRSRGGKPPLDVYRKQQGNDDVVLASSSSSERRSSADVTSPNRTDEVKKSKENEKTASPAKKRNQTRNSGTAPTVSKETSAEVKPSSPAPLANSADAKKVEVVNEDIIRCLCGEEEEEGFMLQCDACLTWQHAKCEGISSPRSNHKEDKNNLPEYICKICREPPGVRESQKYLYNNDFLTKGSLPLLVAPTETDEKDAEKEENFQSLMLATHQLMEELTKMQESLHGIRLKIDVANPDKNHPLLQLWKTSSLPAELTHSTKLISASSESRKITATETNDTEVKKADSIACELLNQIIDNVVQKVDDEKSKSVELKDQEVNATPGTHSLQSSTDSSPAVSDAAADDKAETHSSVYKVIQDLVMDTIRAVSPSFLLKSTPKEIPNDPSKEKHEIGSGPVSKSGVEEKNFNVEKMEIDEKPESSSANISILDDAVKLTSGDKKMNNEVEPTGNNDSETAHKEQGEAINITNTGTKSNITDIWTPVEVKREAVSFNQPPSASRRDRSKSEDLQSDMLILCRGNLLQHIHHLEDCLSERLMQLENYVCDIETSFEEHLRSSPSSSGSSSTYAGRLGELKSDLGSLHDDINAVQKLFSASQSKS